MAGLALSGCKWLTGPVVRDWSTPTGTSPGQADSAPDSPADHDLLAPCEAGGRQKRIEALETLVRRRHPQAHTRLSAALRDHDPQVRTAAIAALGELGGSEAGATLEQLLEDRSELIRAAAVAALGQSGAEQAVTGAAGDESWRVRREVARALARFPGRDGAAAVRRLLDDPSAVVQGEAVRAMAEWPLRQAGPLLLKAMEKRSLTTRSVAARQLAAGWPPAAKFPVNDVPQRRAAVLEGLWERFRQEFSLVDQAALAQAAAGTRPSAEITPDQLARVEQLVRRRDVVALIAFGPGLVEALERMVFDQHQALPEAIYRDVLPRYGPVFAALDRFSSSDVSRRRRAAAELAQLAQQQPLRRLAVARLAQLAAADPDQLVWRSVLAAVSRDPSEPSIRMAYAALSHPLPEVRRRACDHLAAHPDAGHVKVLLPALEDRNHEVLCSAVRALGAAGTMDDTEPLRRLLHETNEEIRLETATALARLGDRVGVDALERLAQSTDPKMRHRVALAMGDLSEPSLVPALIRLLDDRVTVSHAALESLPKVVGHDPSTADDQAPVTTAERIRRWKQWFSRQAAAADHTPLNR